jgi:hypothetical protein
MHRWLRQLPNLISSIRILLVVPIALAQARSRARVAGAAGESARVGGSKAA